MYQCNAEMRSTIHDLVLFFQQGGARDLYNRQGWFAWLHPYWLERIRTHSQYGGGHCKSIAFEHEMYVVWFGLSTEPLFSLFLYFYIPIIPGKYVQALLFYIFTFSSLLYVWKVILCGAVVSQSPIAWRHCHALLFCYILLLLFVVLFLNEFHTFTKRSRAQYESQQKDWKQGR